MTFPVSTLLLNGFVWQTPFLTRDQCAELDLLAHQGQIVKETALYPHYTRGHVKRTVWRVPHIVPRSL